MIRASLAGFGLAALLLPLAAPAIAQQTQAPAQQRSRTEPKPKPSGTRAPAAQKAATPEKPAAKGTAAQAKGGAQAKPGAKDSGKKDAAKPGAKPGGKPAAGSPGPGGAQATLLALFGDWGAYASGQGRAKVCYALSQPKDRQPKDLKREPGYLFVSFRPADNVRNEIAVVMGFATRDGGAAEAVIGTATHAFVTKGSNAWVRNQTEESQVIANMSKGRDMTVKAASARGNPTSDRYSLSGFGQALDRARKECS